MPDQTETSVYLDSRAHARMLAEAALRPVIITLPDGQQISVRRYPEDGTPDVMWRPDVQSAWHPVLTPVTNRPADWEIPTYEERTS